MRTQFDNYDAVRLLETIKNDLGTDPDISCQRTEFNLPKSIGEGAISTYFFGDGFSLFLIKGSLYEDWEWAFDCKEDSPVFIFFSLNGVVEDSKKEEPESFSLKPLNTCMVVQPAGSGRSMILKKGKPIALAVLRIDPKKYFEEKACLPKHIPEQLRVLLPLNGAEVKCFMASNPHTPEAVRLIRDMLECPYQGLLETCYIEAKARQFWVLVMRQLVERSEKTEESLRFVNVDFQKIQEARDVLVRDLKNPPTIEELSKKVGLNQQRLKLDFKMVFQKTIYQYLVSERMHAAKRILMEQKMPIREIAEMVGYENASHFSKRFKEYFGILPSKFLSTVF